VRRPSGVRVVLYEALSGSLPFTATNDLALLRMQAEEPPPPVPGVPEPVATLVGRTLAKDPSARPASAGEFLTELESAAASAYGPDWKKRALVAVLSAGAATLIDEVASSTPAGAAQAGSPSGASAPSGASRTIKAASAHTAKGGLLASHPILAAVTAAVVVAGLAVGGVVVAKGGAASKATPSSASVHPPSFLAIEKAVCGPTTVAENGSGHHCGIRTAKVSTVDSSWVLVQGVGDYNTQGQLDSDEAEAIYNWRTHLLAGPTHLPFCFPSNNVPGYGSVPTAVLTAWGMSHCNTSSSTPTTATSATSATSPSPLGVLVGSWGAHGAGITINSDGTFLLSARTYVWCGPGVPSPCDSIQGNSIISGVQVGGTLRGDGPDSASGTITSSTTPSQVGSTISINFVHSTDSINVTTAGTSSGPFCGHNSPTDYCGA
jgi:hypothetical protein